jgi:hypothetical protein
MLAVDECISALLRARVSRESATGMTDQSRAIPPRVTIRSHGWQNNYSLTPTKAEVDRADRLIVRWPRPKTTRADTRRSAHLCDDLLELRAVHLASK